MPALLGVTCGDGAGAVEVALLGQSFHFTHVPVLDQHVDVVRREPPVVGAAAPVALGVSLHDYHR